MSINDFRTSRNLKKQELSWRQVHHLIVIELMDVERRVPGSPHLFVMQSQRTPEVVLKSLQEGKGPKWIQGHVKRLRPDLIPNFKPTRKKEVADSRVENLKTDLARKGFAINGDAKTWRVYVLDVDADIAPPIKNRGKLNKVVYVGQTSAPIEVRERQHRGELSKTGRYIGSQKVKGRNPKINLRLTPSKVLYTESDAIAFESLIHKMLERRGYRVLGDVAK